MTAESRQNSRFEANHMELVADDHILCERCGNDYNHREISIPENASFYWVPSCPSCNAKMTCNPITQFGLELTGERLSKEDGNYESELDRLHARARLHHGRLVGYSVEEIIRRAKWFDRKAKTGTAYGPRFYRGIAFRLRKQARRMENSG